MKKGLRFIAATLLLVITLNATSYGWGNGGHMAVAFVAYQKLTPQTRSRVDALVRLNPRLGIWQGMIPRRTPAAKRRLMLFMIAATWADQIKGDHQHVSDGPDGGNRPPNDGTATRNIGYEDMAMHKYWHFIDRPFSPDGTSLQNPPTPNAQTQIVAFRAVLASPSESDALKSYDLVWLLHLVGDIHQPLHATARFTHDRPNGDDGGNKVTVCFHGCDRLHAFWDDLFGKSPDPALAINVGQGLPQADASMANNLDEDAWITESFEIARDTAYQNPPIGPTAGRFSISQQYRNRARAIGRQRIALAGARLANILNNELR
jgi:hypothetical protein